MSRIALLVGIARTVPHLGLRNVLRVATYRARLASGWRPRPIAGSCPQGPLFGPLKACTMARSTFYCSAGFHTESRVYRTGTQTPSIPTTEWTLHWTGPKHCTH